MRLVIIESPLRGDDWATLSKEAQAEVYARNRAYARRCMRDSLVRGESPLASHLLYAQEGILDDTFPAERDLGIEAGLAWAARAHLAACYIDLGVSDGMRRAMRRHALNKLPVEFRNLGVVTPIAAP